MTILAQYILRQNESVMFDRGLEKSFQKRRQQLLNPDIFLEFDSGILCKFCGNKITEIDYQIQVNGKYNHFFKNPEGFGFDIICFRMAPGCHPVGKSFLEHTWFASYYWKIAICNSCKNHLGWFFHAGDDSFFGLIQGNLIGNNSM